MRAAILKRDANGADVKKLQLLLNSDLKPSPHLMLDGSFGFGTEWAVKNFQRLHKLPADGVVGLQTWEALGQRGGAAPLSEVVNVCSRDTPWLEIAGLEYGVHEDARVGKQNKRIVEYHQTTSLKATTDEVPWCSSFVNWVITQVGRRGTNNALAKSWLNWGTTLATARQGAVTVIKKKLRGGDAATGSTTGFHVGFLISSSTTHVRLLGGNQSDSVKYSNFALASYTIEGHRWPG
jgi:uncharacterized protein (TIGR02594 family)